MQLVSYSFGLFLFALVLMYYIVPGRFQWILLLAASLAFYSCGGIFFLIFPIVTSISVWFLAGRIADNKLKAAQYVKEHSLGKDEKKAYNKREKLVRRRFMIIGLVLNFGILAVIKYGDFILGNISAFLTFAGSALFADAGSGLYFNPLGLVLPLGISYYTFQTASYLIDVYHGKITHERNLPRFILFATFFPQMIAGPISRYTDLKDQLYAEHHFDPERIRYGLMRILWGYFKKLVIADRMSAAVLTITGGPDTYRGIYVLFGMVGYTIWMYADFAGGIDIVLGVAELFGIQLPENFNRPFFSKSLAEFWRRWHMTLMSWLREYIFFPVSTSHFTLGLMKRIDKLFGKAAANRVPVYIATITVWLTAGIWHGASWKFVAWGMANCVVMLISQELQPLYRLFHKHVNVEGSFAFSCFRVARTFMLFAVLEMFEYYPFMTVFSMFGSLLTESSLSQLSLEQFEMLGLGSADIVILIIGVLILLLVSLSERKQDVRKTICGLHFIPQYLLVAGLFIFVLIAGIYGYGFDASAFVYNQF